MLCIKVWGHFYSRIHLCWLLSFSVLIIINTSNIACEENIIPARVNAYYYLVKMKLLFYSVIILSCPGHKRKMWSLTDATIICPFVKEPSNVVYLKPANRKTAWLCFDYCDVVLFCSKLLYPSSWSMLFQWLYTRSDCGFRVKCCICIRNWTISKRCQVTCSHYMRMQGTWGSVTEATVRSASPVSVFSFLAV